MKVNKLLATTRSRVIVAALVISATAGVTIPMAVGGGNGERVLPRPSDVANEPVRSGPLVTLTTGSYGAVSSDRWELRAQESDKGLCLDLVLTGQVRMGAGGCGYGVPSQVRIGFGQQYVGPANRTWFFGPVANGIAAVDLAQPSGQTIRADVKPLPTNFAPVAGTPIGFFVLTRPGRVEATDVRAFDTAGGTVATRKVSG